MATENTLLKTVGADYDAVLSQLNAMRDDVAKLAHNVQAMANTKTAALSKDVADGVAEASSYIGRTSHKADARIEGAVAANPYIALGIAAVMGVFLGALARR